MVGGLVRPFLPQIVAGRGLAGRLGYEGRGIQKSVCEASVSSERRALGDVGLYDGAWPRLGGLPEGRGTGFRDLKEATAALCKTVREAGTQLGGRREPEVQPGGGQEQVLVCLNDKENPQAFSRNGRGYGSSRTVLPPG